MPIEKEPSNKELPFFYLEYSKEEIDDLILQDFLKRYPDYNITESRMLGNTNPSAITVLVPNSETFKK